MKTKQKQQFLLAQYSVCNVLRQTREHSVCLCLYHNTYQLSSMKTQLILQQNQQLKYKKVCIRRF